MALEDVLSDSPPLWGPSEIKETLWSIEIIYVAEGPAQEELRLEELFNFETSQLE